MFIQKEQISPFQLLADPPSLTLPLIQMEQMELLRTALQLVARMVPANYPVIWGEPQGSHKPGTENDYRRTRDRTIYPFSIDVCYHMANSQMYAQPFLCASFNKLSIFFLLIEISGCLSCIETIQQWKEDNSPSTLS